MPRPKKWRKVQNVPRHGYFKPVGIATCDLSENKLKVEELEAIRLKDLEGLDQGSCAERMEVSRQTFQRIYQSAKGKIADSLINGKAIAIGGGNYTRKICRMTCQACGYNWEGRMEDVKAHGAVPTCPECHSGRTHCRTKKANSGCCCCESKE